MFVVVYGTLKKGYGNNIPLKRSEFVREVEVDGYKTVRQWFPCSSSCNGCTIRGELWKIDPNDGTLEGMDRLEGYRGIGEHNMYDRTEVVTNCGEVAHMYVGSDRRWGFTMMRECPNENTFIKWNR